jgi:hypothetical protein
MKLWKGGGVCLLPALLAIVLAANAWAQAPTGTITGTVTDQSGAVVPNANITITEKSTNTNRTEKTNAQGLYSAPALSPGDYLVKAEAPGFRTLQREAQVTAGTTTTVDLNMAVGAATEVMTVEAASAQINYETQAVQGNVTRQTIQELPLNGRNFLSLASIEPGVQVYNTAPPAQFNSQFYVGVNSALGGVGTRLTVDGGDINDEMEGGSSMNLSQEVVQEFQLSALNYDISTGITNVGAINIVTRSGTNDFHGSAYFFYRDHNMAAYPALKRPTDPTAFNPACANPSSAGCNRIENPFFARKNPGFWVAGPIMKDKLFFFFNLERQFQTSVLTDQFDIPELQPLDAIFASPEHYNYITARFDYHLSAKHTMFVRYSHDGNFTFGPYRGTHPEPSIWNYNQNWSDQNMMGITSTLTPNLVNDLRFQFHYWQNNVTLTNPQDCQAPCIGLGLPSIEGLQGSSVGTFAGVSDNSPQFRQARSYEINDGVTWQKGSHRIRFGIDYEYMRTKVVPWDACYLGCLSLYSAQTTRSLVNSTYGGSGAGYLASYFPTLPTAIGSTNDLLNLPVFNTSTSIYSGFPVGNGTFPGYYEHDQGGVNQRIAPYIGDTWKVRDNLTVNYGVGYDVETGIFYSNIPRPQFLAPILEGQTGGVPYGLGAPQPNKLDFAPQAGFSWALGKSKKTVIRGGAGIYWDTNDIWNHFREGGAIGPVGDGRTTLSAQSFNNIFPNIYNFSSPTGGAPTPIPVGASLPLNALTNMTLGQFIQIYNAQIPALQTQFGTLTQKSGPIAVSGIDVAKTGIEIFPSKFPLPHTYQTSIGVQRDLGHDMVLTVDYARRIFIHTNVGEEDLNRSTRYINGKPAPVIPQCTASQLYVPGQECSNGTVTIWDPEGRSVYNGLLAKLVKRFSNRYQFTASYALQKQVAMAVVNLDNLFAGYGPVLPKQNFNFAGVVNLPWGFSLSLNSSMISASPTTPIVVGVDLNGAGNTNFPITEADPALAGKYNCFNYNCGKQTIIDAITYWNANLAGTKDARGTTLPTLPIPKNFNFSSPLISQDIRLTKTFTYKERYKLAIFGEAFNVLNVANLTGYSTVLNTTAFGQPTSRFAQVFGSGGPRAFQVGTRVSF